MSDRFKVSKAVVTGGARGIGAAIAERLASEGLSVTVLDVNGTPNPSSPFAPLQVGFQTALAGLLASGGQQAVVTNYHVTVAPFCTVAARGFFGQF